MKKNKLSRVETQRFYSHPDFFESICSSWAYAIKDGFEPTSTDMLLYSIIRGKDYRKGFTPISNSVKLANGMQEHQALHNCYERIVFSRYYAPPACLAKYLIADWKWLIQEVVNVNWGDESGYFEVEKCLTSTCS